MRIQALVFLAVVISVDLLDAAWDGKEFAHLSRKIYHEYRTCAVELNRQVFDALAGEDNSISFDEALGIFQKTSVAEEFGDPAAVEEQFLEDWIKAALERRIPNKKTNYGKKQYEKLAAKASSASLTEKQLQKFIQNAKGEDLSSVDHLVAAGSEKLIDANQDGEVSEDEILTFAMTLATLAKKDSIRVKDYVGCITSLIPQHMGPFYSKLWNAEVIEFDNNGDGKINSDEGLKVLRKISSAVSKRAGEKFFGSIDVSGDGNQEVGDGYIEEAEFVNALVDIAQDPEESDFDITYKGFIQLYNQGRRNRVSPEEAMAFFKDIEGSDQQV